MTNLHSKIRSHSVFIQDQRTNEIGSGILLKLVDRLFVVSAAHVIESDVHISLGLYTPNTHFTILNRWMDKQLDLGYLELKPSEVSLLRGEYSEPFVPRGKRNREVATRTPKLALCGFPAATAETRDDHIAIPIMFVTLPILAPADWPGVFMDRFEPQVHFLLPFGPKRGGNLLDRNKMPINHFHPRGFSGSGLWYFDPDTENADDPVYSLIGIQHSYDQFYQVLIGTFVNGLIAAIERNYQIPIPNI